MANSTQAKKRARQSEKRRQHNASLRSIMRTSIKKVVAAIATGNQEDANKAYQTAVPILDTMVNKGISHKNKASRQKSRLNARVRAMSA
ncbi:MAG: 30S ribosomal protein S20 [Gammaproteobacteria bacterium]|nr:30S ribosomal protein S20 [Gammaproteobacteria bacterium]